MPKFRVTNPLGFWDGVHRHVPGTIVQIEPPDYDRLLSRDMEPLDVQAKKDLEECKKRWAPKGPDGKPLHVPEFYQPKSGDLNPHDRDDLKKIVGSGVKVISAPVEATKAAAVVPATATA